MCEVKTVAFVWVLLVWYVRVRQVKLYAKTKKPLLKNKHDMSEYNHTITLVDN